jgi:hypothetical protein
VFDGQGAWFLIVIFVLWVLESIAKARQRSKLPEASADEDQTLSTPTTLEAPPESRPRPQGRPRNLWEELAELARQQQEQQGLPTERSPETSQRGPGTRPGATSAERPEGVPLPRRRAEVAPAEAPRRPSPPRRRAEVSAPTTLPERTASTRWQQGTDAEAVARPVPTEATSGDERRSDRWLAGGHDEATSTEGAATYDSLEARPRSTDLAPRARGAPAAAPSPKLASAGETRRKARAGGRGRPALPSASAPLPVAPSDRSASRLEADVHNLRGASRAELRRILILREVLGPPVALRDEYIPEE